MELLQALLLGLVQGITEWLPVSSSAHLVITRQLLGIAASAAFDVALHAGTLLAVIAVFWKEFLEMLQAVIRLDFKSHAGKTALLIVLATIPAAVVGVLFNDFFESLFSNLAAVGTALLFTAILLYAASKTSGQKEVGSKQAAVIGIAQAAAIAPGISRSGATIAAGMLAGVDKNKAARFSFLLSVPITLGAALFEIRKASLLELDPLATMAGIAVAAAVGYASIKLLLKLVKESKLQWFAYYCWLVGVACVAWSFA
ncbi:undecaprenyl-diphosphate phosphatase [Candidatus Micrarchaeota archaeon]|nr:undecaprenyl-diphosphate phosphatase [Candidatus Micrarchaeota archaeon]